VYGSEVRISQTFDCPVKYRRCRPTSYVDALVIRISVHAASRDAINVSASVKDGDGEERMCFGWTKRKYLKMEAKWEGTNMLQVTQPPQVRMFT
jgi:hypothetical protein